MKFRIMARNGCFVLALLIIVAAGLTFLPRQITPASAAGNQLLPSFQEQVGGQTLTWKQITPWYATASTKRVDIGKWVVKEGRFTLGTIEVGINEFYSDNKGDPGWSIDTTDSIHDVYIPHEITESAYPNEGRMQDESPWGFAESYYGPNDAVSYFTNPSDGPFPYQLDEATGSQALPVSNNMQHQITIQKEQYADLENVYQAGARGDIMGGGGRDTDGAMIVTRPALVFPISVYVLAAAGIALAFGGSVVHELCSANYCGKNSKTWAIMGGIATAIGTVLTILSGYSKSGAAIRAGQLAAEEFTSATRSVAASERMIELGSNYAASRAAFSIPEDISAALPLARARSI